MSTNGGDKPLVLVRSEIARKKLHKMNEEKEKAALERARSFKARECEVTRRRPFQPILPHNRTQPDDVVLHSSVRAEERRKFDEQLEERAKEKQRLEEEELLAREREEELALKAYRQKLEFKARPMPTSNYEPYRPQPSDHQLTVPATPLVLKRSHSK